MRVVCCAAVLAVLMASTGQGEDAPRVTQLHPLELKIIHLTNVQREAHGLPPLAVDPDLVDSARSHADWMSRNTVLQHTSQPVGENIALGQTTTSEAVSDWMRSPGHRANILSGRYRRMGASVRRGRDGRLYWCQQFLH